MPSDGLGVDLGTTGGKWVFKQGDLLLGPVEFSKLVALLYAGEVDESTPVAPFNLEPKFVPLGQVERFRVHLAKAKAKLRVEAQSQEQRSSLRRGRLLKLAGMGVLSIGLLIGGGRLAFWLAIHRPWETAIKLAEPLIIDELPQITLASARTGEEELAYPDTRNPAQPSPARPNADKRPPRPGTSGQASAGSPAGRVPTGRPAASGDDVMVVQQWDQDAINGVVKARKATLHPCLSAEARRQKTGWEVRVPLEFTIGNDGRVSKLWIDNADYRSEDSELFRCMYGELKKWKFPSYQGEQANVSLAFRIQAR